MAKDLVSFPDLTNDLGALDLLAAAARKSIGQKENKDTFKARILKEIPYFGAQQVGNLVGATQIEGNTNQTALAAYYVQIIERSAHSYLPDPCPLGGTSEADRANNNVVQSLYTIAIDQGGLTLNQDDIVFIKLNKKDFSYDTDFGWIQSKIGSGKSHFQKIGTCAKAAASFDTKEIKPVASAETILTMNSAEPDGTVFIFASGISEDPVAREAIETFTNMLTRTLKAEDIPELIISSAYRDGKRQAEAMRDLKGGKCRGGYKSGIPPATPKNAADTSCRGIYNMYANKDLMRELMKLDWNTSELAEALTKAEEQGNIMSNHQRKGAFDLQTKRIAGKDKVDANKKRLQMKPDVKEKIMNAIKQYGGKSEYEFAPPHLHVDLPSNIVAKIQQRRDALASNTVEDTNKQTDA